MLPHTAIDNIPVVFRKTRLAPTPSGYLHLGNVLSFTLTAALAAQYSAGILLRIDDLDRERYDVKYVQDIFDTLHFLEISWHEGPRDVLSFEREYSQVHRLPRYREMLTTLEAQQAVFACDCSRSLQQKHHKEGCHEDVCTTKGLALDGKGISWRQHTDDRLIAVNTLQGTIQEALPQAMRHFVVRKKDGYPAYQLASLADDLHFGVDLIVRGEDLWPSTLAQHYLAARLDQTAFLQSTFHHHPLIKDLDGVKLSKSAGATSVRYLRKEGKKASDVFTLIGNMLGLKEPVSGWHMLAQRLGFIL